MSWESTFRPLLRWLQTLGRNPYFWGGMGALLGIGVGLYVLLDSIVMPSYTRHDASVRVPNVEDRSFETAKATMEEKGLDVQRQVGRYNPNVDQGIVVDQTPLARATVKPGRRVYLTVNSGEAPMVKIPDLNGVSVREAENRVSAAGLEVGTVEPDSIPSPYANTITRQSPAPGDSLQQGSTVDLWYSTGLGERSVDVPEVVGRTVADAQQMLLKNQLRFIVVDTSVADTADAQPSEMDSTDILQQLYVRQQGRSPGTEVRAGTEIRLFTTDDPASVRPPNDTTATDTTAADTTLDSTRADTTRLERFPDGAPDEDSGG
ncbi:MAG: PASTA domain-containing protein [Salinibacter sp.]